MLISFVLLLTFMGLASNCTSDQKDFMIECVSPFCDGQCLPLAFENRVSPFFVPKCDQQCSAIINKCSGAGPNCDAYKYSLLVSGVWFCLSYIVGMAMNQRCD